MVLEQVLGWIATILFSIMLIPQIIKTIKSKTTKGVSLGLFVLYLVANLIALWYALFIKQPPLIWKYVVGALTAIIYMFFYWKYTQPKVELCMTQKRDDQ